ncbi:4'-phosphopantetheinyl transferase family protein [Thiovibrio sp. JS02]
MNHSCPFIQAAPAGAGALPASPRFALAAVSLAQVSALLPAGRYPGGEGRFLCGEEEATLARFSLEKRRREWFGGRLAAKWAVARLLGGAEPAWPRIIIAAAADGKPFARSHPALFLSISHSGPLAGAMAAETSCGLDLQLITPKIRAVRGRFLAEKEEELLGREILPLTGEAGALTLLWAAKEALRKMAGGAPLPGLLETRFFAVRQGAGTPEAPFLLALLPGRKEGRLPAEITVYAWLEQGLAWALTALPTTVME